MTGAPFDEVMLRQRFEAAVGDLSPDIGRLVAAGTADGRGAVARRRVVSGIAAAAVAIVAVGSISYAAQSDLFGQGDDQVTNNPQLVQLVPATPRGLAAALMAHTESLGTPVAVGGTDGGPGSQDWQLSAQVAYDLDGGAGVEVDVYATPNVALWQSCDDLPASRGGAGGCHSLTLPDGTPAIYVEYGGPESTQSGSAFAVAMIAKRSDQLVAVIETVSGSADLQLDQSELAEIVADPAIGLTTTEAFNALGESIDDFKDGGLITSDSGSATGSATSSPPAQESTPAEEPSGSGAASSAASN